MLQRKRRKERDRSNPISYYFLKGMIIMNNINRDSSKAVNTEMQALSNVLKTIPDKILLNI